MYDAVKAFQDTNQLALKEAKKIICNSSNKDSIPCMRYWIKIT